MTQSVVLLQQGWHELCEKAALSFVLLNPRLVLLHHLDG